MEKGDCFFLRLSLSLSFVGLDGAANPKARELDLAWLSWTSLLGPEDGINSLKAVHPPREY